MRRRLLVLVPVLVMLSSVPAHLNASPVADSANCEFVLGFKMLRDMIPDIVGECLVNVHYNPLNGDGLQETSRGLMVWRKADNFTAFTDGYRSWVNGPYGVQQRLNTERFDWESDPLPEPSSAPTTQAQTPTQAENQRATAQCVLIVSDFVTALVTRPFRPLLVDPTPLANGLRQECLEAFANEGTLGVQCMAYALVETDKVIPYFNSGGAAEGFYKWKYDACLRAYR